MNDTTFFFARPALALLAINSPLSLLKPATLTQPTLAEPITANPARTNSRMPISFLPYEITRPGSYYLTANLHATCSGPHGITVSISDVTLDLNGFTLQGMPGSGSGIYVAGSHSDLAVRNGTIRGWGRSGIDAFGAGYPRDLLFENLMLSENGAEGICTEAGSVVRNCVALNNGSHGIASVGGEILRCVCCGNQEFGIVAAYCVVRECRMEGNLGGGFQTLGLEGRAAIVDCRLQSNEGYGIAVVGPHCLVSGNACILNSSGGIWLGSDRNRIENNRVLSCQGVSGLGPARNGYRHNVILDNTLTEL